MSAPDAPLPRIPGIADHGDTPHFAEPWQARAFAMALRLHEAGAFEWTDWADALSDRLKGDPRLPDAATATEHARQYYEAWLATLETMVTRAGLAGTAQIEAATATWQRAALATPHGTPILYERGLDPS